MDPLSARRSGAQQILQELEQAVTELLEHATKSPFRNLKAIMQPALQLKSPWDASHLPAQLKERVLQLTDEALNSAAPETVGLDRAIGAMVGMAIADGLGHNLEFLAVRDAPRPGMPWLEYPCPPKPAGAAGGDSDDPWHGEGNPRGRLHDPNNVFGLAAGQWTDDASMGLCMADSLLLRGGYDGSNMRVWFWNWWNCGLDNAFRLDERRQSSYGGASLSVGLGGNISQSLGDVGRRAWAGQPIPPRYTAPVEDAGNGSLMRLAPVPLRYHGDVSLARRRGFESSLTTHPGRLAAEACAVLSHLIARAVTRPAGDVTTARAWLDGERDVLLRLLDGEDGGAWGEEEVGRGDSAAKGRAQAVLQRLLRGEEDGESKELCWNWRGATLELERTVRNRGRSYNGYPVSAGYFGAFSLDGLAMALHGVYTTGSFDEAIVKVINMAGDADSTGSICGQLAGAFYGVRAINRWWVDDMRRWDDRDIELRAAALWVKGRGPDPDAVQQP